MLSHRYGRPADWNVSLNIFKNLSKYEYLEIENKIHTEVVHMVARMNY